MGQYLNNDYRKTVPNFPISLQTQNVSVLCTKWWTLLSVSVAKVARCSVRSAIRDDNKNPINPRHIFTPLNTWEKLIRTLSLWASVCKQIKLHTPTMLYKHQFVFKTREWICTYCTYHTGGASLKVCTKRYFFVCFLFSRNRYSTTLGNEFDLETIRKPKRKWHLYK